MKKQKIIYIIGKYTGKNWIQTKINVYYAYRKMRELAKQGFCIICPHTMYTGIENTDMIDKGLEYNKIMNMCKTLIDKADAVYILNNWKKSKGSKIEITHARKKNKIIMWQKKNGR